MRAGYFAYLGVVIVEGPFVRGIWLGFAVNEILCEAMVKLAVTVPRKQAMPSAPHTCSADVWMELDPVLHSVRDLALDLAKVVHAQFAVVVRRVGNQPRHRHRGRSFVRKERRCAVWLDRSVDDVRSGSQVGCRRSFLQSIAYTPVPLRVLF